MIPSLLKRLESWFEPLEGSLTTFSGGVDSALVLYLSKRFLGENAIGIIADSPSLKRADLEIARKFCKEFQITLRIIETGELTNPDYARNPFNRCYYCKDTLYRMTRKVHQAEYPRFVLLNGTNQDDHSDLRPGLQAANEQAVLSPLADCGLGKPEVRALAKHFKLPVWNKPASPCLSSRIPYGQNVTERKLNQVEAAEIALNHFGLDIVRVRHFGETAKIETPIDAIDHLRSVFPQVEITLKRLGFKKVQIDEEGLVSGKLNRAIPNHG